MGMEWYVARRLVWAIIATWLAVSLTFGLLLTAPNPGAEAAAAQCAQQDRNAEECRQRYLEERGLNRPAHVQYVDYMTDLAQGDLGYSMSQEKPVTEAIADAWIFSAQYFIPSIIISALAGYGIGLYSALNKYTITDYFGSFVAYFGISIPNFWFAIVLILVVGVYLRDASLLGVSLESLSLRTYYETSYDIFSVQNIKQLILPIIVLSTASVASQMRYSRAQALEYANSDFVKTARAKGASMWRILIAHVLRVALVPLSTILIVDILAVLFAGSFIIEAIFQIPGLGRSNSLLSHSKTQISWRP
ncbi:MAG: ABC-type dipeptide/oligopeptide/nickel transport system, permease component [Haloquadratum sp. J07HQX50]|nr:MAG: ABC-type dipeptide/oligopeptide/nickel transport system, permease component [Haloquadratum sp. J07HQX50]